MEEERQNQEKENHSLHRHIRGAFRENRTAHLGENANVFENAAGALGYPVGRLLPDGERLYLREAKDCQLCDTPAAPGI